MAGGIEGQKAPGEEDKKNFIQWVDVIRGNMEKQAEKRRCRQRADGWRKDRGNEPMSFNLCLRSLMPATQHKTL